MSQHDAVVHGVIIHFVGTGLDHDHLFGRTCYGQLQIAELSLLGGGIDDQFSVHQTYLNAGNGPVPGNVGDGQSDGSAQHPYNFGGAVMVNAHDRKAQDYIVAQILGKEGTDGTVDNTGSQNCLLRGLALSAQIAAGNSAHGIELLVEIHRQGQEVNAVTGLRGGCGGGQDGRFSIADEAGAIG